MNPSNDYADAMASLPLCAPDSVIGNRDVLVVAPHPDDESIGCAGLLAWAAETGRRPRILFLTDGEGSHPGSTAFMPPHLARLRRSEAVQACAALGVASSALTFLGLPDSGLAAVEPAHRESIVQALADWIGPASVAVCVTAATDPHGDHVAAFDLVRSAARRRADAQLFAYPVWSWINAVTQPGDAPRGRRIDIAAFRNAKREAISAHASQHGRIVTDSAAAFTLPAALLACADQTFEVLLDVEF